MKLQHLSVIFIIIMIPIMLVFSYYMQLQKESLKVRAEYDKKLTMALKEAVRAYEINTAELNYYDDREDEENTGSKVNEREAINASINAFTTSIANNLGISGASQERILEYIPAMSFNMYDGFYIYGPTYVPKIQETANGMNIFNENTDEVTYIDEYGTATTDVDKAEMVCEYTLTPGTPYSARYITTDGKTDIIVEYTLDNYIKINGIVNESNFKTEGYLTFFGIEGGTESLSSNLNTRGGIQYLGEKVLPEKLTETITYKTSDFLDGTTRAHNYVYNIKQKKCYYDEENEVWFQVDSDGVKKIMAKYKDDVKEIPSDEYWKTIYTYNNGIIKIYYMTLDGVMYDDKYSDRYNDNGYINSSGDLVSVGDGNAYLGTSEDAPDGHILDTVSPDGQLELTSKKSIEEIKNITGEEYYEKTYDFSAINYFIISKCFSDEIQAKLGDKELYICKLQYNSTTAQYEYVEEEVGKIFNLSQKNNPESVNSILVKHKREVITNLINQSLNNIISNYNKYNIDAKHTIPKITYEDMNDALNNISVFAFMSGMQTGYKVYNDYSFAVSNSNNDYLNIKSLKYINDVSSDGYSHYIYCNKINESKMTAYRNLEMIKRRHELDIPNKECYYCIINRGEMEKTETTDPSTGVTESKEDFYESAYLEATGRERFRQDENPPTLDERPFEELIPKPNPTPPTPSVTPPVITVPPGDFSDPPGGGNTDPPLFL